VPASKVREVTSALKDMGCYEISLGDTTGTSTPTATAAILHEVSKDVDASMLAGHVSSRTFIHFPTAIHLPNLTIENLI
jgi:isopropylmalate/homocitrate/citramalate synthase